MHDPTVDFGAIYTQYDTVLLGRRTYELAQQPGAPPWPGDWRVYVFSRTLDPAEHPAVTVVSGDAGSVVGKLRAEAGRDIWLFGGGNLFANLLSLRLVDEIELAVKPVILGRGIPLTAAASRASRLRLTHSSTSPSAIVNLRYHVDHAAG